MNVQEVRSPETREFIKTLEELLQIVGHALSKRTPQLNGEKYLTNTDLSKLLHVSLRTLQQYRDTGVLGYIQISGKVLYRESEVLKLLESNYVHSDNY